MLPIHKEIEQKHNDLEKAFSNLEDLRERLADFDLEIERYLPPNPPPKPWEFGSVIGTVVKGRDTTKAMVAELSEFAALFSAHKKLGFYATAIPAEVVADLDEAAKCFGTAGAYKSSAVMARRALESVCKDKKAKGKNLKQKIDVLPVDEAIKSICQGIRLFGNHGAHPKDDLLGGVDKHEADMVLTLAIQIVTQVYS